MPGAAVRAPPVVSAAGFTGALGLLTEAVESLLDDRLGVVALSFVSLFSVPDPPVLPALIRDPDGAVLTRFNGMAELCSLNCGWCIISRYGTDNGA